MLRTHWFSTSRRSGSAGSAGSPVAPALAAALLWAAAAGSMLLWWLHRPPAAAPEVAPAGWPAAGAAAPSPEALARALGQTQVPAAAAPELHQRFVLLGVIGTEAGRGSALLAVDGQPAKAFVRGQSVAEGWRLDAVQPRLVRLTPEGGGAGLELALPAPR